jgi:Kef-type K+ transport system membrane component KefB
MTRRAVAGWLISLSLGFLNALLFAGFTISTLVAGLCLTTTALGTILPIVRDAGLVKSPFGARVPAALG